MPLLNRRMCDFSSLEIRADGEKTNKITGYAAVFNSDSVDFGFWKESIHPGAFTRTLKEKPDVRALVDHDTGKIIARTTAGTLKLTEDSKGLLAEIFPSDTTSGRDALESVRSGLITGMSIGFMPRNNKWGIKDGKDWCEILDLDLYEVSLVAFPAYEETSAQVRGVEGFKQKPLIHRPIRERQVEIAKRRI